MSTRRFYFGEKNGKKNTSFSMVIFSRYVSLNILGMLGLSLYILADTFFVANGLGADGLAALNLAIPVYSFISGMGQMIGLGGATRYSINQGKLGKDASHVFSQAVNFVILAAIPLVMLAMLAGSFANIILDYVFIFPLQMGMFGAVLAS